jgi:hypothetical protein
VRANERVCVRVCVCRWVGSLSLKVCEKGESGKFTFKLRGHVDIPVQGEVSDRFEEMAESCLYLRHPADKVSAVWYLLAPPSSVNQISKLSNGVGPVGFNHESH